MVAELQRRNEASGENHGGGEEEGEEGEDEGDDEEEESEAKKVSSVGTEEPNDPTHACTSFLPHPSILSGVVPPEGEVLTAIVLNPSTTALPAIVWNRLTKS